jgi:hypothetical protein
VEGAEGRGDVDGGGCAAGELCGGVFVADEGSECDGGAGL